MSSARLQHHDQFNALAGNVREQAALKTKLLNLRAHESQLIVALREEGASLHQIAFHRARALGQRTDVASLKKERERIRKRIEKERKSVPLICSAKTSN